MIKEARVATVLKGLRGLTKLNPLATTANVVMDKAVRPGIGKVVTNIAEPFSYDLKSKIDLIKQTPVKEIAKTVIKDKPLFKQDIVSEIRDLPYRKGFGLKARQASNAYVQNPDGSYSLNPKDPQGLSMIKEMITSLDNHGHSSFGGYNFNYDPKTAKIKYYDKWDFGLNPGEKVTKDNAHSVLARYLMNKVHKPVVFKGEVDLSKLRGKELTSNFIDPLTKEDVITDPLVAKMYRSLSLTDDKKQKVINHLEKRIYQNTLRRNSLADNDPLRKALEARIGKLRDFQSELDLGDDLRNMLVGRSNQFNGSIPVGADVIGAGSLREALRGTDYEVINPVLDKIRQAQAKAGRGFKKVDNAVTPLVAGTAGGLTLQQYLANKELKTQT